MLPAQTLHVGAGQTYANLSAAVAAVLPGDTILIHGGTYAGGLFFNNLQGQPGQWITIKSAPGATVVFEGGNNAIQLSDPAYLHIQGITFQHQTGNGFNVDDGGTYDTPAHHVIFDDCLFQDISASGNNDLLKLSGLDSFEVRNCRFINGAAGGSGVDMVGCHYGIIENNYWENQGSNSIQAKGGTAWIRIRRNFFRDGGQRTLNLGGSTGLAFFRPDTAHYEAAYLQVFSNVFVGSWAPVAYVGAVYVEVVNNTFYKPENWVIRILQETVDPDRFIECGDNTFINNIIYLDHNLGTETNIGPDTRPETFLFSNNLWFNSAVPNWSGPDIPVSDPNQIVNEDPDFVHPDADDFALLGLSPAIGTGLTLPAPELDFAGNSFATPRSRGALEGMLVGTNEVATSLQVYPNPFSGELWIETELPANLLFSLHDPQGRIVYQGRLSNRRLQVPNLLPGVYALLAREESTGKTWIARLVKQ